MSHPGRKGGSRETGTCSVCRGSFRLYGSASRATIGTGRIRRNSGSGGGEQRLAAGFCGGGDRRPAQSQVPQARVQARALPGRIRVLPRGRACRHAPAVEELLHGANAREAGAGGQGHPQFLAGDSGRTGSLSQPATLDVTDVGFAARVVRRIPNPSSLRSAASLPGRRRDRARHTRSSSSCRRRSWREQTEC